MSSGIFLILVRICRMIVAEDLDESYNRQT